MKLLQLGLLLLLLAFSPSISHTRLKVLSVDRVVSFDVTPQQDAQGYLLLAGTKHQCLLAAAVSERDGQFWVTPLSKENSTHTDGYRYSFQVHLRVGLVWPEISGEIAIFMGPKDLLSRGFRYPGQPLPESWITQLRHIGSPLAEIWPQSEVFSKGGIGVCNAFMMRTSYDELREHSTTHVFIPLPTQYQEVPTATARVFSPLGKFECNISFPDGGTREIEQNKRGTKPVTTIVLSLDLPGLYEIQCRVKYYHTVSKSVKVHTWRKNINVTLFQEPLIRVMLHGEETDPVIIPSTNKTGIFDCHIYSTSPVMNFVVGRADGSPQAHEVELLSRPSPLEIVTKYRIFIPGHTFGILTFAAKNEAGNSSMVSIQFSRAEALVMLVSPHEHVLSMGGSNATFDCVISGHPISSITWARDFEDLNLVDNSIVVSDLKGDSTGLRLTFLFPNYEDSGYYVCMAANQFERVEMMVELIIYPPGSLQADDIQEAEEELPNVTAPFEPAHQLNTTEAELLAEWREWVGHHGRSRAAHVALATILGLSVLLVLSCTGSMAVTCLRRRRTRRQASPAKPIDKPSREPQQLSTLRTASRMALIPNLDSDDCSLADDEEWQNEQS